jgi:osmotically-inducible protein OsmY
LVTHAASRPPSWPTRARPPGREQVESEGFEGDAFQEWAGPYSGLGPCNYRRPDQRVLEDVCDALLEDPYVDASEIEVRVEGGVVTLAGEIGDRAQKWRAEDLCAEVRGVCDVEVRLRVRPGGRTRRDGPVRYGP